MKTQILLSFVFLSLSSLSCGDDHTRRAPAPPADERLNLSTPRKSYLVGEPVPLDLSFRNRSNEPIKLLEVFVEPGYYEAGLRIARESGGFDEFIRNSSVLKRDRRGLELLPGQALHYKYRVLVGRWPELKLAFPAPGEYRVYAVYPLYLAGASKTVHIASNVVELRITEPEGEDATVWQQLKNTSFLALLQSDEELTEQHKQIALKMAEIVNAHPKSGYASALRHALLKVSPRFRASLSHEQASRFGEIMGIKEFARAEDDPKDKRLDAVRKDSFEQQTTVGHVLTSLSKTSGVALDTTGEFKSRTIRIADSLSSVRDCMRTLRAALNGDWERRGKGYFLVPINVKKTPETKQIKADQK